jgi:hypothetical protein
MRVRSSEPPRTAAPDRRREMGGRNGGIGLGGIIVIVGIILMIVWSFWWGLIIGLIGLLAFGGFAKGKWY